jgi:SAM-dependent methyltransferase
VDEDATERLSVGEIELLNANGPYNHAVWRGRGVAITAEEALAGRADQLIALMRAAILARFSLEALKEKTIVDVGCYDGYLLQGLADLPFKRMVGYEPRQKNIDKGRAIREILRIPSRCAFVQADIFDLPAETFDIVLCAGVLHHLTSPAEGIARLHKICRELLFLETLCLSDTLVTAQLRNDMELKDPLYALGETFCGLSGHKVESPYLDGSAARLSVVSLPTVETLRRFLETGGFDRVAFPISPEAYTDGFADASKRRKFLAACVTANVASQPEPATEPWVDDYELGFIGANLPPATVRALYAAFVLHERPRRLPVQARLIGSYIGARGPMRGVWLAALARTVRDRAALEIVKSFPHNTPDKIGLEYGKLLIGERRYDEAAGVLASIVRRLNADWRASYRAFCLLAWCHRALGHDEAALRYAQLCKTANPQFPDQLLERPISAHAS